MKPKIITYKGAGQLGNCLYRLGNLIAFSCKNDIEIVDLGLSRSGYSTFFESTYRQSLIRFPERGQLFGTAHRLQELERKIIQSLSKRGIIKINEIAIEEDEYHLSLDMFRGCGRPIISLYGVHFQADELVIEYADKIRDFFLFGIRLSKMLILCINRSLSGRI